MINEKYETAASALSFFCMEKTSQADFFKRNKFYYPPVFSNGRDDGRDYFFGIACVFITYVGSLYEGHQNFDNLNNFHDFLNKMMQDSSDSWSSSAVINSHLWVSLRDFANKAALDIGLNVNNEIPPIDVGSLINIDEFITSEEARKLLD